VTIPSHVFSAGAIAALAILWQLACLFQLVADRRGSRTRQRSCAHDWQRFRL